MYWQNPYKYLKSLLFIAGFCAYGIGMANHILGGEVSYSNPSGKKYKFQVKLYRNCNDCVFGSGGCDEIKNLDVYVSPEELGYAKKICQIGLTFVKKSDITPTCKNVKSICSGGSLSLGIEEWVFEGYLDADTLPKDYCKYEVSIRVESRLDAWTQSVKEPFYNYTRLNICNGIKNNSAVIQSPAFYLVPQNESFTYNLLAKDPDGDSLSYALVKAEKAFNTNITYPSSFGPKKPLTIYCHSANCDLDNTVWPIEGMDMDASTGWMGFTALTSGQKGFVVMEITEWRKVNGTMTKVGVSRRDLQIEVVDFGNSAPKISTSKIEYFACSNQTFSLDMAISDPVNGTKDSVKLMAWFDLPGYVLGKVAGSINQFDAYFTTKFTDAQAREKPYYLTVAAVDNHCPLQITTYKTFEINVVKSPNATGIVKHIACNRIVCSAGVIEQNINHSWYLFDSSAMKDSKTGINAEFEVSRPGKWYIVHQAVNSITGCITEIKDSINVPYFSLMSNNVNWPKKVCKNEEFILNSAFTGGTAPFKYYWSNNLGTVFHRYTLHADSSIESKVIDNNGCELNTTGLISIFKPAVVQIFDTSLCMPINPIHMDLSRRFAINPAPLAGTLSIFYLGAAGVLSNDAGNYFFSPSSPGINRFSLNFKDKNGCSYTEEFKIAVVQVVPTGIINPSPVCNNGGTINLDNATHCTLTAGDWKCTAAPKAVSSAMFNPAISGAGIFSLYYSKDIGGCVVMDTTALIVNKAPDVIIDKPVKQTLCENSADFHLKAIPAGGIWSNVVSPSPGDLVSASAISAAGKSASLITYSFIDATNQCSNVDSLRIFVNPMPAGNKISDKEICEGDKLAINPGFTNIREIAFNGDFSKFTTKRLDQLFILQALDVRRKTVFPFAFQVTALPGCDNLSIPVNVTIKPRPEITLTSNPQQGCNPLNVNLSAANSNVDAIATEYSWNDGNGWVSDIDKRSIIISDSGYHAFRVKGNLEGCEGEESQTGVSVFSTPVASVKMEPLTQTVTQDYPVLTFSDASLSADAYYRLWQFEKGSPEVSTISKVQVTFPKDTGLYNVKLSITTNKGCKSEFSSTIRVRHGFEFYAPNAFTPNDKGPKQNEEFHITMDSTITFRLSIRNRWGEILFETDNQNQGWNGDYLSKPAPNGVYFWEMEANTIYGKYIKRKGVVTLYR